MVLHSRSKRCVGEYIGRKNKAMFQKVIRLSTLWALICAVILTLVFTAFGNQIIALLTSVESVKEEAKLYLPWLIAFPLLGIWSYMLDGIFIGTTSVKQMQNTMIISVLGIFFPLWFITQGMGNHGLWFSMATFFVARAITLWWCYERNIKRGVWF